MVFGCCVLKCTRTAKDGRMHTIPAALYNEWLQAISRVDLMDRNPLTVRKNFRVCDAHFGEDQKIKGVRLKSNLKKNAIPTLGLPCRKDNPVCTLTTKENEMSSNKTQFVVCTPSEIEENISALPSCSEGNTG